MGSVFKQNFTRPQTTRPFVNNSVHLKREEQSLHKSVVHYLNVKYPNIPYRTDSAGVNMSKTARGINKSLQYSRGWPDLFIAYPSRGYHGLFIELKKPGTVIYLKTGARKGLISGDKHIQEQALVLAELNNLGYFARFGVGENTYRIIDYYMNEDYNGEIENAEMF